MLESEINISVKRNLGIKVDKKWLRSVALAVLQFEGISSSTEMGLLITDNKTIQTLNRIYRRQNKPTDVLSFQTASIDKEAFDSSFINPPDGIRHLGEVVISYPQALCQAREHKHSIEQELALLIIHGILHLVGYDHEMPEDEKKMRPREREILSLLK
jgi:probable rRNA maturation factor